jgi:peptide/nickel transport system permease protein
VLSSIAAARARWADRSFSAFTTLSLSLPWIFLFIILRALLPLNTRPIQSILITFGLMGVAGWAWPARVFAASIRQMEQSGWLLYARASGISPWRTAHVHAWPHLRAIALAQFRILIPAYILSEASLGLLGLGVAEPLPSWGNLLAELQHPDRVRANLWILAPLALLMLVMIALEALQPGRNTRLPAASFQSTGAAS